MRGYVDTREHLNKSHFPVFHQYLKDYSIHHHKWQRFGKILRPRSVAARDKWAAI